MCFRLKFGHAWLRLNSVPSSGPQLGAPRLLAEASAGVEGSAERLEVAVPANVLADIEIDVPRCGITSKYMRASIRRVLLAFAARNKVIGYCQGLNVIVATILLALSPNPNAHDEALAFWLLVVLTEERCSGWWEATLEALRRDVYESCGRARQQARVTQDSVPARKRLFGVGNTSAGIETSAASSSRNTTSEANVKQLGLTIERLVDDLGTPIDLVMTQWLLTIFAHAGAGLAPLGLRLRALDIALCAPNPHGAPIGSTRGPGATALLALALATVASVRREEVNDVVQAARLLEQTLRDGDREALFLAAHVGTAYTYIRKMLQCVCVL